MFDIEELGVLLDDVGENSPSVDFIDLDLGDESFNETKDILFISVFAYALSRFVGSDTVLFDIMDENSLPFPLIVKCENQEVSSYIDGVRESIDYCSQNAINESSGIVFNLMSEEINSYDEEINSYDFNANIIQKDECYVLKIFSSEKYSQDTVDRFLFSFKSILHDILNVNELKDINFTSSSDLKQLDSYNQTKHPLRYDDILDAFNDNLIKYPNNKLVSFKDRSYNYSQGAYIANEIAKKLIDYGIKGQDSVAFLTERSEWYVFDILAILSIGAIYIPLDINIPDERIEFILEDTDSKVLIVSDKTYECAKNLSSKAIILNASDIIKEGIGELSHLNNVYGDVACVLYTSGTTGTPKGINTTRKSILNVCEWYVDKYGINKEDTYGLYASIGFDVASFNIVLALYSGACLSVVPDDYKTDMLALNEYFINQSVTHTWITTHVGKLFMQSNDSTSLDVLMVGGEKLGDFDSPDDFTLVDVCGPTEAFEHVVSIKNSEKIDSSSIGHLNYNTKAYVLDDEFRRVPIGAVGELYLSGYQIADGYLNNEEKTKYAFLLNPFDDDEEHKVLYRTGDMVRILPDGSVGIVGRRDSQVKIRGNRVELSEVESVIRESNYIKDVSVQTIKNNGVYELVAYVVSNIEVENLDEVVRKYVSISKPNYMIPSYVIELDSIPLNINGKVDRKSLPEVDLSAFHEDYVPANTKIEKIIVNAFEEVLNQEKIGLYDDFIRLGGDSISAIRVLSLLQKEGISCSARDIINYQTPFSIAQNIHEIKHVSYDATEGEVDLLPIQSYFFDKINANEYSQEYILKSETTLDKDILQKAFDGVSQTHDMLRAIYRCDDGNNLIQEIRPVNTRVCEINEIHLESDDLNREIGKILLESNASLDISESLIKINLLHYNGRSYLLFIIHHLIIDGVSWSILMDDLTYLYTLFLENEEASLLKPYPYKLWVEDVKNLASNISESEKKHWFEINKRLNDSKIKGKSKIFAFNMKSSFDSNNLWMLSEDEFLALSIARAYKKTYGEDIIFNKESYGRDESLADVNRTIGWFTSQFPVPVNVNNGYDSISIANDVYNLKAAFKDVEHLGINYGSLIYGSHELEFKNCPVTLNFISDEFVYKNELLESLDEYLSSNDKIDLRIFESTSYGITLKISRVGNNYVINGNYAEDTYLGDRFEEFIENMKYEMDFLGNYSLEKETIVSCLSETQLAIYLDEKVRDMGNAYSTSGIYKCPPEKSVDEIKEVIAQLIDKHPILKGRVVESENLLLVCDSYPLIESIDVEDYSDLFAPFNLDEYLARFYILCNEDEKSIFFDIHHLIGDGTNRHLVLEELDNIFKGNLDDALDFGFVFESNDSFESRYKAIYNEGHDFFNRNLSDIDDVSALPYDNRGSENRIMLPIRGIKNKVKGFCHKKGITVSNFLNSIFAYTYSRFTGNDKVFYTYTQHGRYKPYAQKAFGMFARTVPIIVDCSSNSVDDFLESTSDLILNSMKYSIYPFRLLASEFNLNLNGAFEYNYDLNDLVDIEDELIIEYLEVNLISDFVCVVNDLDDGYLVRIDSDENYSNELIIRFLNAFKEILIQILEKENLSDIDYVSDADLKLLDSYNQTAHPLEYEDIMDAFNDNLSKHPNNRLVSYKDKAYTYADVAFIVDKIAHELRELGVNQNDRVAFLTERSEWYLFDALAILSLGAVYVPLDAKHPDERIEFILSDTGAKVIIVSDNTYERAKDILDNLISLNESHIPNESYILNVSHILDDFDSLPSLGHGSGSDLLDDFDSLSSLDLGSGSSLPDGQECLSSLDVAYNDLACILYTSGTTGIPKGVKITRKAVLNISTYHCDHYGLTDDDVYSLFASIGFDVAIKCMFTPILCGAALDIIPDDVKLDMNRLNDHFIEHRVSYADFPTQVARLFLSQVKNNTLKYLFTGGEKLGEISVDCNYHFIDSYGPTEACVDVTCIEKEEKIDPSSIGHLIYNTKAYILDNNKNRVPIGAAGELYLAGYQISEGYLNRDDENAKAFIENPFDDDEDYNSLYRTGDIVRILADGSLGLIGRRDSQVKIRGNRVELLEVEKVIREIDYISDVTVQTIRNHGNYELVAYLVTSKPVDDLREKVCDYVSESKPDYMVPSHIVSLDKIPLNVNGKIDKSALPEIDLNSLRSDYVAPTNKDERKIVKSFEMIFNQEDIGIYDDFVRLGGDSISAIRLVALLQKEGINCTPRDILTYKTPSLIAKNIRDLEQVIYDEVEGRVDLHPIQEFFFENINRNQYSQEFVLKSEINFELEALQKAFDELSNIHDMLRAVYRRENGKLIQEILPVNTRVCEIKEITIDDFEEGLRDIIFDSYNSLDIERELIKINLVHYKDESYLTFVIHHLIIDGVSWSILIDDLSHIYNLIKEGRQIDVLRPYPYKLWVEDIKNLSSRISENEKNHWLEIDKMWDDSLIKGKSKVFALNIKGDFKYDNQLRLTEEEYLGLAIARAYKRTYERDVIFNRESHGRDENIADVSRTIGWFTSQFPVHVEVNCQYDDISLIKDVCALKNAFKNIRNLGLHYGSLVYMSNELKYKHCPVTFNFLSNEFVFKNEILQTLTEYLSSKDEIKMGNFDSISYGITFNVSRMDNKYLFNGDYPEDTYLALKFEEFIRNIEYELEFIGKYELDDIVCPLSESQLGLYLDEKVNDKGTAYSASGIYKCDEESSIDEIEKAIHCLIKKHPIIKSRIVDGDIPLFVCDSYPSIEIVETDDYSALIEPFDLDKSLCRFFISTNDEGKFIFYDMHHIINDATTGMIILNELDEIFKGEFDDSIDLGFAIDSFYSFESKFDPSYEKAHEFYAENLSDIDDVNAILFDGRGNENRIKLLIHGIKDRVEEFCHSTGITVGNFLNAVFAYAYSRFTASDKVFYTYTQHGRNETYAQKALGMFVRTIPIIVDCSDTSIKDYLLNVSDLIIDSMKHSVYPYRFLANEFNLNLNVAFEYNYNLNDVSDVGDELMIDDMEIDLISDFVCVVNDLKDGYLIRIDSCDKYSDELIIRFLEVFREILIQFLEREDLSDIDYISDRDLKLLDTYNERDYDLKYGDILDAFNEHLGKCPDNEFVKYDDIAYSYGEGAFIADKIAKQLIDLNVKKQNAVAFLVERSQWYLLLALGIMSIGAVYVPLDPSRPDEMLKFIMDDTDAQVIIASDKTYERASHLSNKALLLNIDDIVDCKIDSLSSLNISYGELACVLYTSGTTGLPKGVQITRRSVLNLASYYKDRYDFDSDDVYGMFSTIGFDAALLAMMNVLYSGACLSVVPEDIRLDINSLNEYYMKHGVTHTLITSQVGRMFMQEVKKTSLDYLFVGGEKLGEFESPEDYVLVDAFGPTEACVFISSIRNSDKIDSSSIGRLIYNTKVYVLDNEGRQVPIGAVGELYISGYPISKGYLNRDDENEKAFLKNSFCEDEPYDVLYRSGDMVRVLSDGSLGILGRRDGQVKIRGNRVELSEVEKVIREIDYVEDVTVQTIKNGHNNELVAYVVSDKTANLKDSICEYVANSKPDYMVPSFVIKLEEIPLTVNAKVNRRALPKVDMSSLRAEYVPPSTENEKAIVDAFNIVFNQKDIGLNDDFMRLGGDSISSIRIISLLQKNNIFCTAKDILEHKTPYLIAQNISQVDKVSYDAIEGSFDLLPIQKFFFEEINSNDFTQEFVLKANRKLDISILQESFNKLTNIHDMLRASYKISDSPIQQIKALDTQICEINEIEINDDFEKTISDTILKSKRSMDLEDCLIKVNLIHYNGESYLILVIHHLIIDGVSWSILIDDLTHIYNLVEKDKEIDILRPYPYKLWVEDVKELVENISDEEKEHWIEVNDLLDDSSIKGNSKGFNFNLDLKFNPDNLLRLSEEEYWALAISRAYKNTYNQDIIFNRESYGRDESLADVSRTVAWFTSQYPVMVNVNAKYDNISLVKDVSKLKTALKGIKHLGLNYQSLIYESNDLDYKHCPVSFNFLSTEFTFKNEMFESIGENFAFDFKTEQIAYGITFNISRLNDSYIIDGTYAQNTYLGDGFSEFIKNIEYELEFLANYDFEDGLVCQMSEAELGIYLDEILYDRGIAYGAPNVISCGEKSFEEIEKAIFKFIDKHPILKGRVIEDEEMPLIICDSYPLIERADEIDYSKLVKPFDLTKYFARFYIIDENGEKSIFVDVHHLIIDATSVTILLKELKDALNGELDETIDLGFLYNSWDSFEVQFENIYQEAYEFYKKNLSNVANSKPLLKDVGGLGASVCLPIRGIRKEFEEFARECGITPGTLLHAIFAYSLSRLTGSDIAFFSFLENGRHEAYLQQSFDSIVRTVPIVVDCSNKPVKEYLTEFSSLLIDSIKYTIYPYRLLSNEFNLNRDIMFEYLYDLNDLPEIGDEMFFEDKRDLFCELFCVINDLEDGYLVNLDYSDSYSRENMIRFANLIKEVFIQILYKEELDDIDYDDFDIFEGKITDDISVDGLCDDVPSISVDEISDGSYGCIEARNESEKVLVEVFEEIFDKKLGIYDDFIKLGGDSLTAIKIKLKLAEKSIHVDVKDIFEGRTPYKISKHIMD